MKIICAKYALRLTTKQKYRPYHDVVLRQCRPWVLQTQVQRLLQHELKAWLKHGKKSGANPPSLFDKCTNYPQHAKQKRLTKKLAMPTWAAHWGHCKSARYHLKTTIVVCGIHIEMTEKESKSWPHRWKASLCPQRKSCLKLVVSLARFNLKHSAYQLLQKDITWYIHDTPKGIS